MKIAIDAMGGDFGPTPIIEGVVKALKEKKFTPYLVGKEEEIKKNLPKKYHKRVRFINSEDVIKMEESATEALKRKESSIYKSIELLKSNEVDGGWS